MTVLRNISQAFKEGKTSIPLEVIQMIQDNRLQRPFATFLGLKMISSGRLHRRDYRIKDLIEDLRISPRSFNRHVGYMKSINFIGESRSGYLYIRGWDTIRRIYKISETAAVIFYPKYILNINEFLFSALAAINLNTQNWEIRSKKSRSRYMKRLSCAQLGTSFIQDPSLYAGLSIEGFMKVAGVSRASAQKYKNNSIKIGLLKAKKRFRDLGIFTNYPEIIHDFLEYNPNYSNHKLHVERISNSQIRLYVNEKDEIKHNLLFVRKRKLKYQ
jgi:hypothetical protein